MSEEPTESRPIPLIGDISLQYGQVIEHALDAGFLPQTIAGLDGAYQQRLSRGSHHIRLIGYLFGVEAKDQLKTLQEAAAAGETLTFSADIAVAPGTAAGCHYPVQGARRSGFAEPLPVRNSHCGITAATASGPGKRLRWT